MIGTPIATCSGQTVSSLKRRTSSRDRKQRKREKKDALERAEDIKKKELTESEGLLFCPEPGCVRVFSKNKWLQKHVASKQHSIPLGSSLMERAASKAAEFETFAPAPSSSAVPDYHVRNQNVPSLPGMEGDAAPFSPGWASVPWSKSIQRKSKKVVAWLQNLFEEGELTGQKTKPAKAAELMKTLRDDSRKLVFDASERLSKSQIQAWFSKYNRDRKKKQAVANALNKL